MGRLKENLIWVGCVGLFLVVFIGYLQYDREKTKEINAQRALDLQDMSIPPILSERMRNSNWSIKYWISADRMQADCKTAHEYMDQGILEKTITRRGRSRTYSIFDYLGSCKRASQRASDLVFPHVRKWCHYRDTDERLNELCSEWEVSGESYLNKIENEYISTENRFRKITNGYYDLQLNGL